MPKCSRLVMVENRFISWPPCWLAVEVKAEPTLPLSAPFAQRPPAWSRYAVICADIRPNRVGPPMMIAYLDQAGGLWAKGALNGKVGSAFTSTASQHGGQEMNLFSTITNLLHFGMVVVGLPYSFAGLTELGEITGGTPYGATTIAGLDSSRQPSENELEGARYQGRHVAEIANKLFG